MGRMVFMISIPIYHAQYSESKIDFFMQAKALYGTVVWPDNSDIAPELLYEEMRPI